MDSTLYNIYIFNITDILFINSTYNYFLNKLMLKSRLITNMRLFPKNPLINYFFFFLFLFSFISGFSQNFSKSDWKKIPSPLAASVRSFVEGKDKSFLAGTTAGVYKSQDHGTSWEKSGLDEQVIDELFVTNKGTLLAGTYRSGMFRSEDGGKSWAPVGFEKNIYLFKIIQDESNTIFAVASFVADGFDKRKIPTGIFKSADDGLSWQSTTMNDDNIFGISIPKSGLLFASQSTRLSYSKDHGSTWMKCGIGLPDSIPVSAIIASKKSLFASVGNRQDASGQNGGGIFRSDDDGLTWIRSDNGIHNNTKVSGIVKYDNLLFASTASLDGSGSQGIYKSIDDGANWTFSGIDDKVVRFIKTTSRGELIAGTDGDCLFISKNKGKKWEQTGKEFENWETFNIYKRDQYLFVSDHSGRIWKGNDKGENWKLIGKGIVSILPSGRLITFTNNQIMVSDDKSDSWKKMADLERNLVFLKSLNDTLLVACTNQGLYYSTDEGNKWKEYNIPDLNNAHFRTAVITPKGTIITAYRSEEKGVGILRSEDGGISWEVVNQGLFVWALQYHDGNLFAGNYAEGVFKSSDDGKDWTPCFGGKKDGEYTTVTSISSANDSTLFFGTLDRGVFKSTDKGITWKAYNTGLTNLFNWDIITDHNGILYTATQKGIFKRKLD
jgi:photosystem II stability/assembly factor-like uncharacterized protein